MIAAWLAIIGICFGCPPSDCRTNADCPSGCTCEWGTCG